MVSARLLFVSEGQEIDRRDLGPDGAKIFCRPGDPFRLLPKEASGPLPHRFGYDLRKAVWCRHQVWHGPCDQSPDHGHQSRIYSSYLLRGKVLVRIENAAPIGTQFPCIDRGGSACRTSR